ncbi:MAG: hypothetical protein HKO07_09335, partial [Pseudomonadales bacterium]|nr:hypothetical protein [Pseudomonadales bacterium]
MIPLKLNVGRYFGHALRTVSLGLPIPSRALALTFVLSLAISAPVQAEDIALPPCEACETLPTRSFVDVSHSYVSERFDMLARWIDGFFGERRADTETAHSFVRIRAEQRLAESGQANARLRLRGKIRLPLLNERLRLVFFEEDSQVAGESLGETDTERQNTAGVGLQYNVADKSEFRLDYRLGLRSGDQIRSSIRMRYLLRFAARSQMRLTEELYWQDTRGFGSTTIVDVERLLNPNQLLRLSTRFDFSENTTGLPWSSVLSFRH